MTSFTTLSLIAIFFVGLALASSPTSSSQSTNSVTCRDPVAGNSGSLITYKVTCSVSAYLASGINYTTVSAWAPSAAIPGTRFYVPTTVGCSQSLSSAHTSYSYECSFTILSWFPAGVYTVDLYSYSSKFISSSNNVNQVRGKTFTIPTLHRAVDICAPEVTNITWNVENGQFVGVDVSSRDSGSGVAWVSIIALNANNDVLLLGDTTDTVYGTTATLTHVAMNTGAPAGRYFLQVVLKDQAGNKRSYSSSDLESLHLYGHIDYKLPFSLC